MSDSDEERAPGVLLDIAPRQDISGWNVEQVTNMNNMFRGAKAFDQDLGWFVCDGVNLELAFWNTQCARRRVGAPRESTRHVRVA